MMYKYIVKNVGLRERLHRHLHAQAALRRQRLRHAHPPEPVEGRARTCSSTTRPSYAMMSDMMRWYIGGLLKHCPAILAFAAPSTNSYRRLVPGYEAPINLVYSAAQPLGLHPHPDDLGQPGGAAPRVPHPGPVLQPLPLLLRLPDGRPRRGDEQDRAAGPGGQGHLRAGAGRGGQDPVRPRQPGRGARRARGGPRVPAAGWTSSPAT